ncbi:acetyl-CoA synthetase-like protein [Hygrophoropsis aurantiaca]|uniref:Acetyl-CoA synthetase-like protein n=1 Tax=Hygrophoropsis aurantiaca TaxID=72124 RepID=A0ACB8AFY8_9AGAM|nr:acetyl-CoA synthetase-like protein [Hygrophoropsis aurantiaca]
MDFLLKPANCPHALGPGCTFSRPPLDGSLTLPQIYDWHYTHNPNHPIFEYANRAGTLDRLTYSQLVPAVHAAGHYVADVCEINLHGDEQKVVAIIAASDTITYFTTLLGMLHAGIVVFPISPRNPAAAIAHLLSITGVSHILTSGEPPIRELAKDAADSLKLKGFPSVPIKPMPSFNQVFNKDAVFERLPPRTYDYGRTALIVHSSGSTSFPKPIFWNHRSYLQVAIMTYFGKHDLCEKVFACHGANMFHAIGLNLLAWISGTGLIMATFDPESPPAPPSPDSIYQGFTSTNPDFVVAVPSFFDVWSHDPAKVEYFKRLQGGVVYGGGPLTKAVGDYLASQGVTIYTLYGASEVGVIGVLFPEKPGPDWDYIPINPHCAAEFVPDGDGAYELVVVSKPTQELPVVNFKFRGVDAYASSDLLAPHPTKPGYWKILGRADDQITLSTGEKTNPGPLESILCQHPLVASVVMFGRGRFQNGALIELQKGHEFDPTDQNRLVEFRAAIWDKVQEMNSVASTYSRLFKEMIIVATPSKPFTFTPKGAPKRSAILKEYEDEINQLYADVERSAQQDMELPTDWTLESILVFVRTAVNNVLPRLNGDGQDIFAHGCDSLQATWIRNSILRALRASLRRAHLDASANFVYENPTIKSLGQFMYRTIKTGHIGITTSAAKPEELQSILTRYTSDFPKHVPSAEAPSRDVVLVTGTTGALGCGVLAHLAKSDSVQTVYAFNRSSSKGESLLRRQQEALRTRGYSPDIATQPKVVLVEGDLSATGLDINDFSLLQKQTALTFSTFSAWRVDFNLTLASFETAVGGVRTLVDLALSSPLPKPPRIIFTSTVGVLRNWASEQPVFEEPLSDSSVAIGQGYSESKWVSERILDIANAQTAISATVVRVGQISGGINGAWNSSDWLPLIVSTSLGFGAFPGLKGQCSWIPLDFAALALCEFRNSEPPTLHLAHPHPIPMDIIVQTISNELKLKVVPFTDWMAILDQYALDESRSNSISLQAVPALKIIDFLRGVRDNGDRTDGEEVMGIPSLAMVNALKVSPTLANTDRKISLEDVRSWLQYWKSIGWIL